MLSEGRRYIDLRPAQDEITPRKAPGSPERGLDGWAFLMRTEDRSLAFLYFENKARRGTLSNAAANAAYRFTWYNTRTGEWLDSVNIQSDGQGRLQLPPFPADGEEAETDWAAKLVRLP